MTAPFLTACWENLAIITYRVDAALLAPRLPPGMTLDEHPRWPGMGLVSLVAFDFRACRVKGVRWRFPGTQLVNFPEINLRFYVHGPRGRGVCFIREYVPSTLIAAAARLLYNEPYAVARMTSRAGPEGGAWRVRHEIAVGGRSHTIDLLASLSRQTAGADSLQHFFKEHQWGYGVDRRGRPLAYEVRHPEWEVMPVESCEVNADFGLLYGKQWAVLNTLAPVSTVLAVGSEISVYPWGAAGGRLT